MTFQGTSGWYGDGVRNTAEENSSVFFLIWMLR